MKNVDFAYHAMRMARRASDWAADSIMPGMNRDRPVSQEAADRYIKEQRELLNYIEQETRA